MASAEYMRKWRAENEARAAMHVRRNQARQLALIELARKHPAEYQRLYNEFLHHVNLGETG